MTPERSKAMIGASLLGFATAFFTRFEDGAVHFGSNVQMLLVVAGVVLLLLSWRDHRSAPSHAEDIENPGTASQRLAEVLVVLFVAVLVGRIAHGSLFPLMVEQTERFTEAAQARARKALRNRLLEREATDVPVQKPTGSSGWTEEQRAKVRALLSTVYAKRYESEARSDGVEFEEAEVRDRAGFMAACMAERQERRFPDFESYMERNSLKPGGSEFDRMAGEAVEDMEYCANRLVAKHEDLARRRIEDAGPEPSRRLPEDDLVELGVTEGSDPVAYAVHASTIDRSGDLAHAWIRTGHAQDKAVEYSHALALWQFRCEGRLEYRTLETWIYSDAGIVADVFKRPSSWQATDRGTVGEDIALMICDLNVP